MNRVRYFMAFVLIALLTAQCLTPALASDEPRDGAEPALDAAIADTELSEEQTPLRYGAGPEVNVRYYYVEAGAEPELITGEAVAVGERPSEENVPARRQSGVDDFGVEYSDVCPFRWYETPDLGGDPVEPAAYTVTQERPALDFYTDFSGWVSVSFYWWSDDWRNVEIDGGEEFVKIGESFLAPGHTIRSVSYHGAYPAGWRTADGTAFAVYTTPVEENIDLYPVHGDATVTYYYNDASLGAEELFSGGKPTHAPRQYLEVSVDNGALIQTRHDIAAWRTEGGVRVDPAAGAITEDAAYYAILDSELGSDGSYPALRAGNGGAYISGMGDGTFAPGGSLTRGQAAVILYRLLGTDGPSAVAGEERFSDVAQGAWYHDAVMTLASYGILGGYPDGTFKPGRAVTRAEFIAMLCRFYAAAPGSARFADVAEDAWYFESVCSAAARGWVNGYDNGDGTSSFRPAGKMTRAEAVAVVNRALGRDTSAEALADREMPFSDVPESHWAYYHILAASPTFS